MEQLGHRISASIGGIAVLVGVLLLLSSFSWVPSSVLAPVVGPQRVERPADGYAVSLPFDWEHADARSIKTDGTEDEWWDRDQVDPVRHHAAFVEDGGLLLARPRSPFVDEICRVLDLSEFAHMPPAWSSVDDAKAFFDASPAEPDAIDTQTAVMGLPAGPVLCIDFVMRNGDEWRDYLFTDGTDWHMLSCGAPGSAPRGRWLSIAETFEFLPRKASASIRVD